MSGLNVRKTAAAVRAKRGINRNTVSGTLKKSPVGLKVRYNLNNPNAEMTDQRAKLKAVSRRWKRPVTLPKFSIQRDESN